MILQCTYQQIPIREEFFRGRPHDFQNFDTDQPTNFMKNVCNLVYKYTWKYHLEVLDSSFINFI